MMPIHMDSYPQQRNQIPFPQMMYESWPHGNNNYGYPNLMPCHGCCGHCNFPGYYGFRPTCSHFPPPPPPFPYWGHHHPPFPEPYPSHYAYPPHHGMEQQRYECNKDAHRDNHCCGFPNHLSYQNTDKGLKIEEQEPDVAKKSESLVPIQSKNYPYPIVWFPPEYLKKNDEHGKPPFGFETTGQEKVPLNKKSDEDVKTSEGKARGWNGWFPFDMNILRSLMQGEDEKRELNQKNENGSRQLSCPVVWMPSNNEQKEPERKGNSWVPLDMNNFKSLMQGENDRRIDNQQNGDYMRQFQYPIIWMPSQTEQGKVEKRDQRDMNDVPISTDDSPSGFKFIQVKPPESDNSIQKSETEEANPGGRAKSSQITKGTINQKIIPVKQVEEHREDNTDSTEKKDAADNSERRQSEPLSGFKFMQAKPPESDCGMKKSEIDKENPGDETKSSPMTGGTAGKKIIPVKQVEAHREDNSDSTEKKDAADNCKKRQSSYPSKTSKLPPVCLRLEPLSRKKKGNGNSRSPSPPSLKRQSQEDTPKPSASSSLKDKTSQGVQSADVSSNTSREVDPKKVDIIKIIDSKTCEGLQAADVSSNTSGEVEPTKADAVKIADGKTCKNKTEHLKNGSQVENCLKLSIGSQEDESGKSSMERRQDTGGCDLIQEDEVRCEKDMTAAGTVEEDKLNDAVELANGESKAKKKNLSDVQAAVLIQSAYRGFEVRKLEPLKKLKQLAEVRGQVAEIRSRIQALECLSDLPKLDMERVVIGEMIMRLLLILDTIQGVHPSLRDTRKALAKDLVTLQEELDSLTIKSKEVCLAEVANDSGINACDDAGMQEMQNRVVQVLENSSEICNDNIVNIKELSSGEDLALNSQGEEISEPALGDNEVLGGCEHEVRELPGMDSVESPLEESASDMVQDKATYGEVDVLQAVVTERQEQDDMHLQLQLPATGNEESTEVQLQDSYPEAVNQAKVEGVNGGIDVKDNLEAKSSEIHLKMIDEDSHVPELENDESSEEGKSEVADGEVKSHMLACPTLPTEVDYTDGVGKTASNIDQERILVAEPPNGALEEDLAVENKESETETETKLVAELPVGVLKGDLAVESKGSETEYRVGELPVGVLEEDESVNEDQCESERDKVLCSREAMYDVTTGTTTSTESEDVVMVDKLLGNAVLETENNPPLSSTEGEGEVSSCDEVLVNKGKDHGRADVDQMPSPELVGTIQELGIITEEDVQQQAVDGYKEEDEVLEKEPQCHEPESVVGADKMFEVDGSKITIEDTVAATPPPASQVSADDRKLIEENAKLREMMEKLMEAGKEQLTVISQLTGRVKDLERKLSRKKTLKTPRRYKRVAPSSSSSG